MSLTNEAAPVRFAIAALLAASLLLGCATSSAPPPPAASIRVMPPAPEDGRPRGGHRLVGEGKASYYSQYFVGRKTASGERYDPERMTAAHKTLPLGTWVRVTRNDGRFVEVRINDRCGCGGGHIIDLSRAAARRLNMIQAGSVPVRVEVIQR